MKNLEDTHCEVQRIIEIKASIKDRLNTSIHDESGHSVGSPSLSKCSVSYGGFFKEAKYAWLSKGPRFIVINSTNGDIIASWTFRNKVTCAAQIPTQLGERLLILVGLDNGAAKIKDSTGMLCVFDCSKSHILRTIRMPVGVEQVCVLNGGAEPEDFSDKEADGISTHGLGIAFVTLKNLYHIIIDLERPFWEENFSNPDIELSPCEIELSDERYFSSSGRSRCDPETYLAHNLLSPDIEDFIKFDRNQFESSLLYQENSVTAIAHSKKIGCLISGCLGRIIIWHSDGSVGWISPPTKHGMPITHFALLEPSDDPKPFHYLWVAYQEESFETAPILQMYALLVEAKYCGTNSCFKIEGEPSVKFELHLDTDDRITSLMPIERTNFYEQSDSSNRKGEESLLLIGQKGKTLLFDLNQWYKEQMPRNMRECQDPNIFLSRYHMRSEARDKIDEVIIDSVYVPSSLREFPCKSGNPLEELFYPRSLAFEWMEIGSSQLRTWMTRGLQWELLRKMGIDGPSILIQPRETFHSCLAAGLVPFNTDCSVDSDENAQREMLLSLCLEQRWASFLIKCANEWVDGSVGYLFPMFLRWGAQRAASIKIVADQLCIPLFDQSGSTMGDTEIRILRFCAQQLECLSNVVAKLPKTSHDLTLQQRALRRVATHLGVLLWFYDVGLLPETHEMNEEPLPITFSRRIPYPYERLAAIYRKKRESIRATESNNDPTDNLFIDELMTQECRQLRVLWEREGGDLATKGYYPPPSLQLLLRSYLLDCDQTPSNEMETKHQITIYLLMDLVKLLQGSCPDVDQLIKYPSAFKMSPSLIKVTQAFWLLDHDDYQGFMDTFHGQLVADSDVKDWHHRLVMRTLIRNKEYKLALTYLRVRKPPLSAIEDQSTSISLSVECGLVHTAFHQRPPSHYRQLLSCFFRACKSSGKLNEILHLALDPEEEKAFVKFLEEDKAEETRLLYYLQRCHYTEINNTNPFSRSYLKAGQSAPLTMVHAYNATLPNITKTLAANLNKKRVESEARPRYPRPMSHKQSYNKTYGIHEAVIRKARETYTREDTCQIPFITAPCTSLKPNNADSNSTCVIFPTLARKPRGKRSSDDMTEDDEDLSAQDHNKRRKLSDLNNSFGKTESRRSGTSIALDTPLVRKKRLVTEAVRDELDTPHSILKIRQMIEKTASPRASIRTPLKEQEVAKDSEKKPARQIRFSIGQVLEDSTSKDVEDMEVAKPESSNGANETIEQESESDDNEEVFYSPKAAENANSTNESNYSVSSITGPRPRPSLRRSNQSSFNESHDASERSTRMRETPTASFRHSMHTPSMKLSAISSTPLAQGAETTPHCHCPVSNESKSQEESSENSSEESVENFKVTEVDESLARKSSTLTGSSRWSGEPSKRYTPRARNSVRFSSNLEARDNEDGGRKPVSVEVRKSITVSHSSFTKTTLSKETSDADDDEDVVMEVDDFGLDHEPELCFGEEKEPRGRLFGEVTHERKWERTSRSKESQPESWNDSEESARESSLVRGKQDEENDDCYQSLTNSDVSFGRSERPSVDVMEKMLTERTLERETTRKESFGLPVHSVVTNLNITEDESSSDLTVGMKVQESQLVSKKSEPVDESVSGVREKKSFGDLSNFTEDESVDSSMENFELVADDSEMEEEIHRELKQKNASWLTDRDKRDLTSHGTHTPTVSQTSSMKRTETQSTLPISSEMDSAESSPPSESSQKNRKQNRTNSKGSRTKSPTPTPRTTRSRRAGSISEDMPSASHDGTASNVSTRMDESESVTSTTTSHQSLISEPNRERKTRSQSREKDTSLDRANEERPLRRSSRRAASVQKEMPTIVENSDTSVKSSKSNSEKDPSDSEPTTKKTRRTRKLSKNETDSNESNAEQLSSSKTINRRRSNSVPKDLTTGSARLTRASSLMRETIPEEKMNQSTPLRRVRGSTSAQTGHETSIGSPATNTRSRSHSVQSIPDEVEDQLGKSNDQRASSNMENVNVSKRGQGRARRATSLEPSSLKPSRKTRNTLQKNNLIDETIEEEFESITEAKSTKTRGRKKTDSTSSSKDSNVASRMKISQRNPSKSEDSDVFLFSAPEVTSDSPICREDVEEVPAYVFSPPHLRSRLLSEGQERRDLPNFISPLTSEEKRTAALRKKTIVDNKPIPVTTLLSRRKEIHVIKRPRKPFSS